MVEKKQAEKLGECFELGFKKAFVDLLPMNKREELLKDEGIDKFNKFLDYKIKSIILRDIPEDFNLDEEIINYFKKMVDVGYLAGKSYISDMIFSNGNFKPDFIGRVFRKEENYKTWENADLLFKVKNSLYVFELTLHGGKSIHNKLYAPKGNLIELNLSSLGINVDVGYEDEDLIKITDKIINYLNNKNLLVFYVSEYGKLIQLLGYVFDFLYKTDNKLSEVFTAVIYPFHEGLKAKFKVPDVAKEIFREYARKLFELVDKLKPEKFNLKKLDFGLNIDKYIKDINCKSYKITPTYGISTIRKDVENIVNNIEKDYGNVVALCHPAGAGKTTAIIKKFLKDIEKDRVLFIYFSPRIAIIQDKSRELKQAIENKEYKGNKIKENNILVIDREDLENKKYSSRRERYKGVSHLEDNKAGYLRSTLTKIQKETLKNEYKGIAIFHSMQALTNVKTLSFKKSSTIQYLKNIIEHWKHINKEDIKVILVLDEILADNTGLFKLQEILRLLNEYKEKIKIYVLDANLSNGYILEKILKRVEEYKQKGINYLPSAIYEVEGDKLLKNKYSFNYEGWEIRAYTKPSFIGKSLNISFLIDFFSNGEELINRIYSLLIEEKEKSFVYIQNKNLATELKFRLEKEDKKVFLRTAYISNPNIDFSKYDFVIATSSISRGIDIPFKKAYGFFYEFSSEQEISEFYQAISRLRGIEQEGRNVDELLEREVKVILFRTLGEQITDSLDEITEINLEEKSKFEFIKKVKTAQLIGFKELILSSLEAYINPQSDKRYYLAFPEIKEAEFTGNRVSKYKELLEIAGLFNINLPFSIINISEANSEYFINYPFKFYKKANGIIELNKRNLFYLKIKIENEGDFLTKKKEILNTINELLKEHKDNNIVRDYLGDNLSIVEYMPFRLYEIDKTKKVNLLNKYISRKNLSLGGKFPIVRITTDKRLIFSLSDNPVREDSFNPKIPIEIFFQ